MSNSSDRVSAFGMGKTGNPEGTKQEERGRREGRYDEEEDRGFETEQVQVPPEYYVVVTFLPNLLLLLLHTTSMSA